MFYNRETLKHEENIHEVRYDLRPEEARDFDAVPALARTNKPQTASLMLAFYIQ